MLPVLEIFHSIDGEGTRTGELATFIRLKGCNLHCIFCDTAYSIAMKGGAEYQDLEIEDIVKMVRYHNVTITGGEPLIHAETIKLVEALVIAGHHVNIETNGTMDTIFHLPNMFYTVDYKCIYSKMKDKMNPAAFCGLNGDDVVKMVVASREDMEDGLEWYNKFYLGKHECGRPWLYLSPVFGKIEPKEIVEFVKEKNLDRKVRVQVQLHKIIWDPAEKMV